MKIPEEIWAIITKDMRPEDLVALETQNITLAAIEKAFKEMTKAGMSPEQAKETLIKMWNNSDPTQTN